MTAGEQVLTAMSQYGLPVLALGLSIAGAGVPLPATLMLIAAGSFVSHGEMSLPAVLLCGVLASVAGDQFGYWLGRWGGRFTAKRFSSWISASQHLEAAERHVMKSGGIGIFLTRWLLTPLGSCVNLVCGWTRYPWHLFLLWDICGETLWVVLFVLLGKQFSHQVQAVTALAGDLTWAAVAFCVAVFLGWRLLHGWRSKPLEVRRPSAA